ncbi:hypothetical protein AX16_008642 [Volvariella volvacea WC 439]|nr:hypothetical protein AX16_008642 [Volvariella volvacea WC 439]
MYRAAILQAKKAANPAVLTRSLSQAPAPKGAEGWLFIDSVLPIQVAGWDLRHYIGVFRQEYVLAQTHSRVNEVLGHKVDVLSVEPYQKDGGVFVHFKIASDDTETVWRQICQKEDTQSRSFTSWLGVNRGMAWVVRGLPWKEDMNRFASPTLKVSIEGDNLGEQELYSIFRPYGRISSLATTSSATNARLYTITFHRLRSAVIARNVLHGYNYTSNGHSTHIRASYSPPTKANAVGAWLSGHPKIMFPLLIFVIGTLTYTIFDPIRSLMVEAKVLEWFNYQNFSIYRWLMGSLGSTMSPGTDKAAFYPTGEVWVERQEAQRALENYLQGTPETVLFLYGPPGSGKTSLVESTLNEAGRRVLTIDCRQLQKATSDSQVVGKLAEQTGYWPVLSVLISVGNVIDLVSLGLVGQKAGFSTAIHEQIHDMLQIVALGLRRVGIHNRSVIERDILHHAQSVQRHILEDDKLQMIRQGIWHDGRLDCIAGNGVISELGVGDEPMNDMDANPEADSFVLKRDERIANYIEPRLATSAVTLPVVVIHNYQPRTGTSTEPVLDVFASWAASLVLNNVAHVIIVSDKKESVKRVAKALPTKPPMTIALGDADAGVTLSVISRRLQSLNIEFNPTPQQINAIGHLGGRASDLDNLISKLGGGQKIEEAVEELITRSASELRVLAFGGGRDGSENLPWSQEQAWGVLKALAQHSEVSYYDVLLRFPFNGDDEPLQRMEHAELISIVVQEGRPAIIKPGRPLYKWAFVRLLNDAAFQAAQDILYNEKLISRCSRTITNCEQELALLKTLQGMESKWWWQSSATSRRVQQLLDKMVSAERKVELAEKTNKELQERLATLTK